MVSLGAVTAYRLSVGRQSELGSRGAVTAVSHQYDSSPALGRVEGDDECWVPAGDGDNGHTDVGQDA